jgi:hypothetical protein
MTDTTHGAQTLRPLGWAGPTGARVVEHITTWTPLDNHTPARKQATLTIERYDWPTTDTTPDDQRLLIPFGLDLFPRAHHALWLLDDADNETVKVYYSAGWHEKRRYVTLHPLPIGMHGGFGPRTTYHLMITSRKELTLT